MLPGRRQTNQSTRASRSSLGLQFLPNQIPVPLPETQGLSSELISRTGTIITHTAKLIATLDVAIALQGAT